MFASDMTPLNLLGPVCSRARSDQHKRMKTMPLTIGVPTETVHGERRLCVVPDVVKRYLDRKSVV